MNIHVKLLDEGTIVYRHLPAKKLTENIYLLQGHDIYDPEDEKWEFSPDTCVFVEQQELDKVAKWEVK